MPGREAGGGKSAPGADPGTRCQQSKQSWAAMGHWQLKHLPYHLRHALSESLLLLCRGKGWGSFSTQQEGSKAEGQLDEGIKVLLFSRQPISQTSGKAAEQTSG